MTDITVFACRKGLKIAKNVQNISVLELSCCYYAIAIDHLDFILQKYIKNLSKYLLFKDIKPGHVSFCQYHIKKCIQQIAIFSSLYIDYLVKTNFSI